MAYPEIKVLHNNPELTGLAYTVRDVVFSHAVPEGLKLTLMLPWHEKGDAHPTKRPLIVFVQGSGWTFPNIDKQIPQLSQYARAGFAVATVTHRNAAEGHPFPAYLEDVKTAIRFLRAHAEEYGIDFVNMNLMDDVIGITPEDYSLDRHMNGSGARKVADYLGGYVRENYDVPDRRGEQGFESWDVNAATINNDYIAAIDQTSDYFDELAGSDKTVLVVKNQPSEETEDYKQFITELDKLGVSLAGQMQTTLTDNRPCTVDGSVHSYDLGGKTLSVNFEYQDIVFDNQKLLWFGPSDFIVVVYDEVTGSVVDTTVFMFSNRYELQRSEE